MIDLDMARLATQAVAGDGAVADVDGFDDLIDARDVFAFVLEASGHGPLASDRLMFMRTSEALVTTVLLVSRTVRPMSDALFYEFTGVSADDYKAVNAILGLDPATGGGDWPAGLLSHTGAAGPGGGFIVFEVRDSRESQGAWMASRLGPALGQAGVREPARVEWLSVVGHYNP